MELKFRLVSSKGSKGGNADEAAKVNYSDKNRKSVERAAAAAAASFAPEKNRPFFAPKPPRLCPSLFHASLFTLGRGKIFAPTVPFSSFSMANAIERIVVAAVVGWQGSSVGLVTH